MPAVREQQPPDYWGDSVDPAYANYFGNGINRTVPVGQYPSQPVGVSRYAWKCVGMDTWSSRWLPSGSVIDPLTPQAERIWEL